MGKYKDLIFYHSGDLDGECSAAIAYNYYTQEHADSTSVLVLPCDYPFVYESLIQDILSEPNPPRTTVVDYCLPEDVMGKLKVKLNDNLIWIDHHETSINKLSHWHINGLQRIKDSQKGELGACALTWEFFYPELPLPPVVEHIALRDVWRRDDELTEIIHFGLHTINTNPRSAAWPPLLDHKKSIDPLKTLTINGEIVMKYQKAVDNKTVHNNGFPTNFDGLEAFALNTTGRGSDVFENTALMSRNFDLWIIFRWTGSIWSISLYNPNPDNEINCAKIAESWGGGGHKNAAGFQTVQLPESLNPKHIKTVI